MQIYGYPAVWCNPHVAAIFQTSVLKEVHILDLFSPQYYSAASMTGSK